MPAPSHASPGPIRLRYIYPAAYPCPYCGHADTQPRSYRGRIQHRLCQGCGQTVKAIATHAHRIPASGPSTIEEIQP